jgi:hypothetical protein
MGSIGKMLAVTVKVVTDKVRLKMGLRLMTHGAVFAESAHGSIASDGIRLMTHEAFVSLLTLRPLSWHNRSVCHQP